MASPNSSVLSALPIPTLDPRFAGFTKQGYPREFSIFSILLAGHGDPPDLREVVVGEDLLHGRFVHGGGAPKHPASDVRNASKLEHSLYCAVLTVWTMQYGEDHVNGSEAHG
jgi:hypothetical protein